MANILVIPSIDIQNGKMVRSVQGIPELNCTEYGSDPVEMARIWRAENAKMLYIVDFNGAQNGEQINVPIVEEICNSVIIPVIYTGGIRSVNDAKRLFDIGIYRLVVNTISIINPELFKEIIKEFGPSRINVSLDVVGNELVIKGRTVKTGINPIEHAKNMVELGIERFIVTDVTRNGMMTGPNIPLSKSIGKATKKKITLSGGVRNKDELMDVQSVAEFGVDSVIVGRAMYENRFPCQKLWRVAENGIFN